MASEVKPVRAPVVEFMVVRAPETVSRTAWLRHYIRDDLVRPGVATHVPPADAYSVTRVSAVGRLVYDLVFCRQIPDGQFFAVLRAELLALLTPRRPYCDDGDGDEQGGEAAAGRSRLAIEDLERHAYLVEGGDYYLLPDTLSQLSQFPLVDALRQVAPVLERARLGFDRKRLTAELAKVLQAPLDTVVFDGGATSTAFAETKRALFDALYLLYLVRRWVDVNLAAVIGGLQTLHVLEALAIDIVRERLLAGNGSAADEALASGLARYLSEPGGPEGGHPFSEHPLIADATSFEAYLSATPVVHSLFARLQHFTRPFNDVKPIGVGDLKVVKQWLRGYTASEIAHVDTVLKSEFKSRVHRRLEKTEDTFSYSSEQQQETTRDTQTTERFEMKREAEEVVKTDVSANAGLSVNVNYQGVGYNIVSNVTGGFAYARSRTETERVADNYARDVVDKAVSRIQSRVHQQRSTTKLFETEETNTHTFDNTDGENITGIYRWLDKNYRARVYNFGKRMMFEFVVPEPAAFLVESRLRAFEANLELPVRPTEPPWETIPDDVATMNPDGIDEAEFRRLSRKYDLTEFTFPEPLKVDFIDSASGRNYFTESSINSEVWQARTYNCRLDAKDYQITKLVVQGYIHYWGRNDESRTHYDVNTLVVSVDGHEYVRDADNTVERWYLNPRSYPAVGAPRLRNDQVTLVLGFWDVSEFYLSVYAELDVSPAALKNWQAKVLQKIKEVEQARVDAVNSALDQVHQAELATYRNRLAEIRSLAVNEILQGQSEAANRQVVLRELKRQCISMLTKEFDANSTDDVLTELDDTGVRQVDVEYRQFRVSEEPTGDDGGLVVSASYELTEKEVGFPVPDLPVARRKGRYVQFIEQAFEWQQLAYICYPYFWATPPRWVELMNRADRSDPFLSEFLQAGSARVLIAVTPAYDDAVLHYLATGEPWNGGPAPVIGDALFIPLYEELRRQRDDQAGAVPEGTPWDFTLPTSLVYLDGSSTPLPPLDDDTGDPEDGDGKDSDAKDGDGTDGDAKDGDGKDDGDSEGDDDSEGHDTGDSADGDAVECDDDSKDGSVPPAGSPQAIVPAG